jgi:hypothetical protein
MASKVLVKRSSTAGAVPTAAQLSPGELALNIADGALFYLDSSGAVARLTPFKKSVSQSLPAIANGATNSFTVAVSGVKLGMVAHVNAPAALLPSLSFLTAYVSAVDTVTVFLKASAAIAAGARTFDLRVFP